MTSQNEGAGASANAVHGQVMSFNPANFPLPSSMDCRGDVASNWEFFKQQWNDYELATGLDKKEQAIRLATLRSLMGRECLQVFMNLKLTEEDRKDVKKCLEALEDYFKPRRNVVYERYNFNSCVQGDEPVNSFANRLRKLAASCEYGELTDELIRDRLVIGLKETSIKARLLRGKGLDLNRAIQMCTSSEAAAEQLKKMQNEGKHEVEEIRKMEQMQRRQQQRPNRTTHKPLKSGERKEESTSSKCNYCGGTHKRGKGQCPAYGVTCNNCKKKHHFAKVCRQKEVNVLTEDTEQYNTSSDESIYNVESVGAVQSAGDKWYATLDLRAGNSSRKVTCQMDCGSTCNVISFREYCRIVQDGDPALEATTAKLKLYDGTVMIPLGTCNLSCRRQGQDYTLTFQVVKLDQQPLLSAETCEALRLLTLNVDQSIHAVGYSRKSIVDPLTSSEHKHSLTSEFLMKEYGDVFEGLGCLPGEYHIEVDPTVRPVQHAPRRVPVPLKTQLKKKIDEMEKQGIIVKVTEPTDWISSLVAVQKPNKLRVCIDPRNLNEAIKRPKYPMPTVDEILPKLAKAKVFSVLDAKDGFFQVKLDEESSRLTTFWTPFGRYRYQRMPQGISSAPEEYQRRQTEVLAGLNGVEVIADDILCYGCGESMGEALTDHDINLLQLLERAREVNLKFNKKKLRLRLTQVPYMGQLLTQDGLKPDPMKVAAIVDMPRPDDKKAVQRLLGCVNYLSRFMPKLSEVCEPLRRLTEKEAVYVWESQQEGAFTSIKNMISSTPVLKYYDVSCEATIQCDASESGLGATLLQGGQPVAFASRSLTPAERRYAQIEKECLAIAFACTRFDQYLHGRELTTVDTDHKPLVPIFQKPLHAAPKRLQRMLLRLQKYNLHVQYLPGSKMFIADTLSRAYLPDAFDSEKDMPEYQIFQLIRENQLSEEISQINQLEYVRLSNGTHHQIKNCTSADPVLQTLMNTVMSGWPDRRDEVPACLREFWTYRDELTAQDGVLYKGMKVIIPSSMRPQMIARVHSSHLGPDACVRRARDVLFWPGMSGEIKDKVKSCEVCNDFLAKQQKEPLMTHKIPDAPWSKVGQDMFSSAGETYLVTVDYYSDYFELDLLHETTAAAVISATKSHFARHGIADMVTDNGPQYSSEEFSAFARKWEFTHTTSSPLHSQSNGKSESAVKIAKKLIKKAKRDKKDVQMALLEWRNTPDDNGNSPVQKLMSRRTRTTIPTTLGLLKPQVVDGVPENIKLKRQKAKATYDKHARPLPELETGEPVRLQPTNLKVPWEKGTCIAKIGPRSYLVESEKGQLYRRNRKFIRQDQSQKKPEAPSEQKETATEHAPETRTASKPLQSLPVPALPVNQSPKQLASTIPSTCCPTTPQDIAPVQEKLHVVPTTRSGRPSIPPAKFKDYVT